jgi:hypothetical protein
MRGLGGRGRRTLAATWSAFDCCAPAPRTPPVPVTIVVGGLFGVAMAMFGIARWMGHGLARSETLARLFVVGVCSPAWVIS